MNIIELIQEYLETNNFKTIKECNPNAYYPEVLKVTHPKAWSAFFLWESKRYPCLIEGSYSLKVDLTDPSSLNDLLDTINDWSEDPNTYYRYHKWIT